MARTSIDCGWIHLFIQQLLQRMTRFAFLSPLKCVTIRLQPLTVDQKWCNKSQNNTFLKSLHFFCENFTFFTKLHLSTNLLSVMTDTAVFHHLTPTEITKLQTCFINATLSFTSLKNYSRKCKMYFMDAGSWVSNYHASLMQHNMGRVTDWSRRWVPTEQK